VFGLDFQAVGRDPSAPARCAQRRRAVLLVSEDLDELLELSDRVAVLMSGRIVFDSARPVPGSATPSAARWAGMPTANGQAGAHPRDATAGMSAQTPLRSPRAPSTTGSGRRTPRWS
jgi:energy-coupling factor transporter ATP-binding protein EcfA2